MSHQAAKTNYDEKIKLWYNSLKRLIMYSRGMYGLNIVITMIHSFQAAQAHIVVYKFEYNMTHI